MGPGKIDNPFPVCYSFYMNIHNVRPGFPLFRTAEAADVSAAENRIYRLFSGSQDLGR